jgi:hypothetical protein
VGIDAPEMAPHKRARGGGASNGILRAAQSVAKDRHKPEARIPDTKVNRKPKEAGRGAERLTTLSSQGIYHQPLPGPSFQQGWAVEAADGQLVWVVGREEAEAVQREQEQQEETKLEEFKILKKFKPKHKALLEATEADRERGTVQEIKCRLCPDTKLKTWEDFKRHCDAVEAHPLKISFCEHCGDFFARGDSLERHYKKHPAECLRVTPAKAALKRTETESVHAEFIARPVGISGCPSHRSSRTCILTPRRSAVALQDAN